MCVEYCEVDIKQSSCFQGLSWGTLRNAVVLSCVFYDKIMYFSEPWK